MADTAAGGGSDDDSDQLVSIHEAAENCNVVQLQRALAAGVSPNITRTGQSAIHILCLADGSDPGFDHEARMACLDLLRQSPDFDVNLGDGAGDRAIHYVACHATSRDDVEFMQAVVDAGADVNAAGGRLSRTALHWATSGPARPARGSPANRGVRVSRGLLLTIYATRYATHTKRPTKHRASSAGSSPRRRPQKIGTRRARSRRRAPRAHLIKRPRPPP